MPIKPGRLN
jgi:hypothetical protein